MTTGRLGRAFTLMELTVSLAISALLMAALGSAVAIAAAALPDADAPRSRVLDASRAIHRLSEDLQNAVYVLDTTPSAPVVGIPDRNKDGAPDTLALVWSGVRGDPIQVVENGATPETALSSAAAFSASFRTFPQDLTTGGATQLSENQTLADYSTAPTSEDYVSLDENIIWFQVIRPTLPAEVERWYVEEIDVFGRRVGNNKGDIRAQIRSVAPDGSPTDTVLGDVTVKQTQLGEGADSMLKIKFSSDTALDSTQAVGLVLAAEIDAPAGRLLIENGTGSGLWTADASGGSLSAMLDGDQTPPWSEAAGQQLLYTLIGRYETQSEGITITRRFVSSVGIDMAATGDPDVSLASTVDMLNRPQIVRSIWEAEFETDPTAHDINADGVADWGVLGGGAFRTGQLGGGVWKPIDTIITQPAKDLVGPVVAEIRWRCTDVGQAGAAWSLSFDQSGGLQGNVRIQLGKTSGTEQALAMTTSDGAGTTNVLAAVDGLDTGMIDVRVVVDPVRDLVALYVDGDEIGAYPYLSSAYIDDERVSRVQPLGTGVEVDFVRIREGVTP